MRYITYSSTMKQTKDAIQFFFIGMFFLLFFTVSCARPATEPVSHSELLLGTICRLTIYDNPSQTAFDQAFETIAHIEQLMSAHLNDSEIALINAKAGIESVPVSSQTFFVIKTALEAATVSSGAFDPTIGPLVAAWGIGSDNPRKPSQEEINRLLPLEGYQKVSLDEKTQSVFLQEQGMMLDLGGIAKGYAADEVAKVLRANGVEKAIINLGGNVLVIGSRLDNTPWRIGIQNPEAERGGYIGIVDLIDKTLVTSGPYERFFVFEDEMYHHIIDTKNGYPVKNGLSSVSIITTKSIEADALSTAAYSLGLEKGMALIESLEGVEAVFVDSQKQIYLSEGLKKGRVSFTLSDTAFTIASTL